jgi:rhodanese-related sulfurtransferase
MTSSRYSVINVNREELKAGLADGSIILVDVREPNEFREGHIPGAVNFPLSGLDPSKLPVAGAGQSVVLNCRSGRRTLSAIEMSQLVGRKDIIRHYPGSMAEWLEAKEPIER